MIDLEKLPKENLYAFFDGSQYDGSERWYDSINKVKATVENGTIGVDESVFLKAKRRDSGISSAVDSGRVFFSNYPLKSNLFFNYRPKNSTIYFLVKIGSPTFVSAQMNPPYIALFQIFDGEAMIFNRVNTSYGYKYSDIIVNNSGNNISFTTPSYEQYHLYSFSTAPYGFDFFIDKNKIYSKKIYESSTADGNIYIGDTIQEICSDMSIKAIAYYQDYHNDEKRQKIFNWFADTYHMPQLLSEDRLIAQISRLDSIAIAAALEANFSRHKGFKQIVNSYRKGVC